MKIALCQMEIEWEDKEQNLKKVKRYIEEASLAKADIVLFPEMSLTGFSMNIEVTQEYHRETVEDVRLLAALHRINVGIGWVNAVDRKAENHYTVIDCAGEALADYVKIHPFSYAGEDNYFDSGDQIVTFHVAGVPCTMFICYDLRFPEIFQAASKIADIVFVPANWPGKRAEHWKCLLKARAIENQVYMAGVNCVGSIGGSDYQGDSSIINPLGEEICSLNGVEGLLIQSVEDDVKQYRKNFPVKKDRKTELYKKLL